MKIIRKTKSLCPKCFQLVDAVINVKDNKVFLSRNCENHGPFEILLSRSPVFYEKLDKFYFDVMGGGGGKPDYEIWGTLECNMTCRICALGEFTQSEDKLELKSANLEEFLKKHKHNSYTIAGAEPTCKEDLETIIKTFKKYNKTVTLNTNGLKFIDIDYLNRLKVAGLDRVNLQFDGFQRKTYSLFRGADLLDERIKILDNLKILNIPTALVVPVVKNVNENEIFELVNYAAQNQFVNAISFLTICSVGYSRNYKLNDYIMPDELIDILESKSNMKISRKKVYAFQKLHLAVKSLFSQRHCFYNQAYVLVRGRGSELFEPIDNYLNLDSIEPLLDIYGAIYKRNRFLAKVFLPVVLPVIFFRLSFFKLLGEIILSSFSYFLKTGSYLKSKNIFYLSLTTGCDPYKFDQSFIPNCQNEIIHLDKTTGSLEYNGCEGLYIINLEKKHLLESSTKDLNNPNEKLLKC